MSKRRCAKKPVKYYSKKRRAVYADGDEIKPLVLFELHGWICWICKKPVNRYLRFPNYYAATVEHVVPLCKGGTHTWDNCVLAHALCNFSKGDSLPDDYTSTMTA